VKWRRGFAEVRYRSATSPTDRAEAGLTCRQLIVTLPLGVLNATPSSTGAVRFDPPPHTILKAAAALQSGHVYRVTFRFADSDGLVRRHVRGAVSRSEPAPDCRRSSGIASLARILRRKIPAPEAFYFHDWQADPFARGAYSYVPVGATRHGLSRPAGDTLFFAGEAANRNGNGATVHGAIESGVQAARLILGDKAA
jgi:hypothetical protein